MFPGTPVAGLCSLSNKNDIFQLNFQGSHCSHGDRSNDCQLCPPVHHPLLQENQHEVAQLQMSQAGSTWGLISSRVWAISRGGGGHFTGWNVLRVFQGLPEPGGGSGAGPGAFSSGLGLSAQHGPSIRGRGCFFSLNCSPGASPVPGSVEGPAWFDLCFWPCWLRPSPFNPAAVLRALPEGSAPSPRDTGFPHSSSHPLSASGCCSPQDIVLNHPLFYGFLLLQMEAPSRKAKAAQQPQLCPWSSCGGAWLLAQHTSPIPGFAPCHHTHRPFSSTLSEIRES